MARGRQPEPAALLNYGLNEATPDHVTISRTRRLLDEATHQAVFRFVLTEVARRGLLKGKTIGIDATTLEANAAMRSIVRRDTSESYMGYLRRLAAEAGIDASDDDAVRRMDRKRKKKTSNKEWVNPHDRQAEVTKMKDGTTHLAYKAEQAVDLETGAIVAISTHGGAVGDSESVQETLPAAGEAIAEQIATPTAQGQYKVHEQGLREVVTDKGYHSGAGLATMSGMGVRTYVSVPGNHGATGKANGSSKRRYTPTGGVWQASVARVCCGGAASCWSAPSRISMRRVRCGGYMCVAAATSPSGCCCRRRRSTWR